MMTHGWLHEYVSFICIIVSEEREANFLLAVFSQVSCAKSLAVPSTRFNSNICSIRPSENQRCGPSCQQWCEPVNVVVLPSEVITSHVGPRECLQKNGCTYSLDV